MDEVYGELVVNSMVNDGGELQGDGLNEGNDSCSGLMNQSDWSRNLPTYLVANHKLHQSSWTTMDPCTQHHQ